MHTSVYTGAGSACEPARRHSRQSPALRTSRVLHLVVAAFVLLAARGEAKAGLQPQPNRASVETDDGFGAPAYGTHARGMARARRARWRAMQSQRPIQTVRPSVPVRPGVWHPIGIKTGVSPAKKAEAKRDPDKEDEDDEVESVDASEAVVASGAEGPSSWWTEAYPIWDRVVDSYTARTVRKHTFNTLISHRNYGGWLRDTGMSLFGFDKGLLKVQLGLRFGIFDFLDVGAVRLNGTIEQFDTYEFDLRWAAIAQSRFGLDIGVRAGVDWFVQPHANDAIAGFGEVMIGRLNFDRVYSGFNVLYNSNSSGPKKSVADTASSAAVQFALDWRVSSGFCLPFELTYAVAGYRLAYPNITFGPKWVTNRHMFAIVLSNTQYTTTDGIVTNTDRIAFRDWVLGFNITREL